MTDLVVSEGYAAVGYEYINVDDCWLEKNRGPNNELVADRRRFPSGMRSLSDYVRIVRDNRNEPVDLKDYSGNELELAGKSRRS